MQTVVQYATFVAQNMKKFQTFVVWALVQNYTKNGCSVLPQTQYCTYYCKL